MIKLDSCLRSLVPIIQRAVISYSTSPDNTNALIVDVVESFNSFGFTAKRSQNIPCKHNGN